MTIYSNAYDTTVGSAIDKTKIKKAIQTACLHDMIYLFNLDLSDDFEFHPFFISGKTPSESNIPLFQHPFCFAGDKGKNYIVSDMRQVVRPDAESDVEYGINIKNKTEFLFIKARTVINMLWASGHTAEIKNSLPLAATIFSNWLSNSIRQRFALSSKDQIILTVVSHLYYQNLFCVGAKLDEDKKQQFAIQAMKATRVTADFIFPLMDEIEALGSINDYCETVKKITENVRLEDFNAGFLITTIGNSWFGLNSKDILAIALEHPPTWVTLVYFALFDRSYRNSIIAKLAENYGKTQESQRYINAFNALLDEGRKIK